MTPPSAPTLETARLHLVGATRALLKAEMHNRPLLSVLLGAEVLAGWPPEHNDLGTMQYMLDLIEHDPANLPWGYFYVVLCASHDGPRLIGGCGFKGKPDDSGSVEIGYSFLKEYQDLGYGTEAVEGLVRHAFSYNAVESIVAETFPEVTGSIRVLEKNRFQREDGASEPGALRFRLRRTRNFA